MKNITSWFGNKKYKWYHDEFTGATKPMKNEHILPQETAENGHR